MCKKEIGNRYKIQHYSDLADEDRILIDNASNATSNSYAPYSEFSVGCAVLIDDGSIITSANQENCAYPSGMCAERIALYYAGCVIRKNGTDYRNIKTIAISAKDKYSNLATAFPCGACRQAMIEFEVQRKKQPIRILVHQKDNSVAVFESVKDLLPMSFDF